MKYLSILIGLVILVESCTLPVSVEEINTIAECENTKLVKELLPSVGVIRIYIGVEFITGSDEFNVVDNYLIIIDDSGSKTRIYLCDMISAELSESGRYLYLTF
jgi:hypothetical protein